jgi:CelD/BcsL family acetyltransferase involved in cellulose biosynthesis
MRVVAVDPRKDHRWRRLAAGNHGSLFTSPPWIGAVCETYGFTPQARIAVEAGGELVGGLTWVPVRDIRGERLLSLPFSDRADPLLESPDAWPVLAADALATGQHLTLRCRADLRPPTEPTFRTTGEAAWHGTPLDAPPDELLTRFSSAVRRNLATAQRKQVGVTVSTSLDSIRTYHGLHVALRKRKYRLLAQPREFFERIWENFIDDDAVVTILAHVGDEAVAGAVYLVWGETLYYKFGASLAEFLPVRPNDAIHWAAIRWACERGLHLLDWGLSDLDQPGLVAYKRKWASVEHRIVTLQSGVRERNVEADDLLAQLTQLFVHDAVPDTVTESAGALLYRYFC